MLYNMFMYIFTPSFTKVTSFFNVPFVNWFQVKQFKMSVDELTVEIANNSEMYDFVRLKKEIYAAFLDLSRSQVFFFIQQ